MSTNGHPVPPLPEGAPLRATVVTDEGSRVETGVMRQFDTGATRHTDAGKLDFEGFLSPHVLKRYAEYLDEHRTQADGKLRASDNWQQGIPLDVYMKSQLRHTFDQWGMHRERDFDSNPEDFKDLEDTVCAVMFNAMGYLFEILKDRPEAELDLEGRAAFKERTGEDIGDG